MLGCGEIATASCVYALGFSVSRPIESLGIGTVFIIYEMT